jgi:hypothetical protein
VAYGAGLVDIGLVDREVGCGPIGLNTGLGQTPFLICFLFFFLPSHLPLFSNLSSWYGVDLPHLKNA